MPSRPSPPAKLHKTPIRADTLFFGLCGSNAADSICLLGLNEHETAALWVFLQLLVSSAKNPSLT
jgi:hypothetical protein